MKKLLALLFLFLVGYAGFAQAPTSVYWLKSRVDGSVPTPISGWGSLYFDYVTAKWKICNGTSCYDLPIGTTTRNNLPPSTHTSSFTLAPADTSKMHILSGGSGAIVITLGTFSGLSGKGLQFPFIRDRIDTVYFAAGSETLVSFGTTTGIADSTISYLYYNGTTDKFYLANGGGSGGGSSSGGGSGTVTSVSVTTANGVSGSVATATTTPAISLTLGAITPTSINGVVVSGSSTPTLAVTGTSTISGTNTGDQTTVTGNAGTATALATSRTIGTLTGDATSAGSGFNGTANNTNAVTLATVNSNVGTFGSATQVAQLTTNAKGLTTAVTNVTITPAASSVVNTPAGNISSTNAQAALNELDGEKQDALGYIPLAPANDLSDVSNAGTALQNLGGLEKSSTANTQTGDYTLQVSDFAVNTTIYMNSSSAHNLTIPLNATAAIPIGRTVLGRRIGTASITFVVTGGVTVVSAGGSANDPGQYYLWALTKIGTDSWYLDNGGAALGSANQLLAVNNAGTAQEYKTVSNGLTSASGSIKLGGPLTADTNLSGAFSLGIGVTPTSKLHVNGLGTTTGDLATFQANDGTVRLNLKDNGKITWVSAQSGAGILGFSASASLTATANTQTMTGYDFNTTVAYGGFTGDTAIPFRVRDTGAANDYWNVTISTSGASTAQNFNSAGFYNFSNAASTSIIRNNAAALSIRGGTTSTTRMVQFAPTSASSTNANATFNFTGNTHDYGSAVTRTNTEILNDATITSVNGSTLTYTVFDNSPGFTLGTSTATLTGYNYNPTLTSGTFTHYGMRVQSGLSAFGHTNVPGAFMDLAASTTSSASLRIRSGTAPSSPNDGDIWQDGTNYFARGGSTTYTLAKTLMATATLDFPNTTAGQQSDLTITVTGAADGDAVNIGIPNGSVSGDNITFWGWVSAANTVTIRFNNSNVVAAVNPASGTFRAVVIKY